MANIFNPEKTETTKGFVDELCNKLRSDYAIKLAPTPDGISKDEPLLVICLNSSRIAADIRDATQDIKDFPDYLVAIVIIHVTAKHVLPKYKTSDSTTDENLEKYGLMVDFAYLEGHLYECEMNTNGVEALQSFLKKHIDSSIMWPDDDDGSQPNSKTTAHQDERSGHKRQHVPDEAIMNRWDTFDRKLDTIDRKLDTLLMKISCD